MIDTRKYNNDIYQLKLKVSEASDDFRATVMSINDKLIILSGGSISLILTFLGVLFSSNKSTSDLEYVYILFALLFFLASMISMFFVKYCISVYVYTARHRHYLLSEEKLLLAEFKELNNGSGFLGEDGDMHYSGDVFETEIADREENLRKYASAINKFETREQRYHQLYEDLYKTGYILIVIAYGFSIVFFVGVMHLLNRH